ncbi:MAG: hypothetical protein IKK24_06470 [Clostridia bacterium]|nr:hypothetical protein [Clostridia bacterium]
MIIKGIIIIIGFIFAIIGLCEFIHTVKLMFLASRKKCKTVSVVWLKSNSAVEQISFVSEQLCWLGGDFAEYVIAVTDEIDKDELDNCRSFAEGRSIIFCAESALTGLLCRLSKDD